MNNMNIVETAVCVFKLTTLKLLLLYIHIINVTLKHYINLDLMHFTFLLCWTL